MYSALLARPYDINEETLKGWWDSVVYYLEQIVTGAWVKAIAATITAFFLEYLHGDVSVLYIYIGFALVDIILGRFAAKRLGVYDTRKIKYWARKQSTHLFLLIMVGLLSHATLRTSGYDLAAVNWFLLFLTYVEAASIEDKLKILGWPVHPLIHKIFGAMRKKASRDFSVLLNDPDICDELERALSKKRANNSNNSKDLQ